MQGGFIPPVSKNKIGVPARLAAWGAAKLLEFEVAAALRDQIIKLRGEGK